jgi:hypothetical protein
MSDREESNPYGDLSLREAFRRGWRACVKAKPRPEESLFEGGRQGRGVGERL